MRNTGYFQNRPNYVLTCSTIESTSTVTYFSVSVIKCVCIIVIYSDCRCLWGHHDDPVSRLPGCVCRSTGHHELQGQSEC